MFRIALCDDEPEFNRHMRGMLKQELNDLGVTLYQCDEYLTPGELLAEVERGVRYHILLMDILLGEQNGIEAAKRLRDLHSVQSSIIFVSIRPQFVLDTFAVGPENFLVKPVSREKLRAALRVSLKRWEEDATIAVADEEMNTVVIRLGDIDYLEVYRKQLVIHMGEKQIICSSGMAELMKKLPEPRFFRCHRSFIVNLGRVDKLGREKIVLKNSVPVPLSRRRYEEALRVYARHMGVLQ